MTIPLGGADDDTVIARFVTVALTAERPCEAPRRLLLESSWRHVRIGRGRVFRSAVVGDELQLELADRSMSSRHASMRWDGGHWRIRDEDSKNGTFVGGAAVAETVLRDGDLIEAGSTMLVYRECLVEPRELERLAATTGPGDGPIAARTLSPSWQRQLDTLARAAASDVPIMLTGETGTGKELVARAIHEQSARPGELVAVNCGAIAANLLESELFGHRKGAFSGADRDHEGLVRAADRGTLLLDELAEMPHSTQVALLRVLQEREVRPVGATRGQPVDLRVVTATHADMGARVAEGRFRADLYARLAGLSVAVPPLRDRRDDLGLILGALLGKIAGPRAASLRLHPGAARAIARHDWPHNVRELEQALRVALSVCDGEVIELADLPASLRGGAPAAGDAELRAQELSALLREHRGNVSAVARALSTSRSQVRRLSARYDLDPDAFR